MIEVKEPSQIMIEKNKMIVSSTDPEGHIVYVNDVFCEVAGFDRDELIGNCHNILRHPDMPGTIFKLFWSYVLAGKSIYAFVKNKTKNGDYYWVKAYAKPIVSNGKVVQITSYRKPINPYAQYVIEKLYKDLSEYEKKYSIEEAYAYLMNFLEERNLSYHQFVDRLSLDKSVFNKETLHINYNEHYNAHVVFKQSILHAIEKKKKKIDVVESCCCDFGKWCEEVKGESFTKCLAWGKMQKAHDRVHQNMKEYVQKAQGTTMEAYSLEQILRSVDEDTKILLDSLIEIIDKSEE